MDAQPIWWTAKYDQSLLQVLANGQEQIAQLKKLGMLRGKEEEAALTEALAEEVKQEAEADRLPPGIGQ